MPSGGEQLKPTTFPPHIDKERWALVRPENAIAPSTVFPAAVWPPGANGSAGNWRVLLGDPTGQSDDAGVETLEQISADSVALYEARKS